MLEVHKDPETVSVKAVCKDGSILQICLSHGKDDCSRKAVWFAEKYVDRPYSGPSLPTGVTGEAYLPSVWCLSMSTEKQFLEVLKLPFVQSWFERARSIEIVSWNTATATKLSALLPLCGNCLTLDFTADFSKLKGDSFNRRIPLSKVQDLRLRQDKHAEKKEVGLGNVFSELQFSTLCLWNILLPVKMLMELISERLQNLYLAFCSEHQFSNILAAVAKKGIKLKLLDAIEVDIPNHFPSQTVKEVKCLDLCHMDCPSCTRLLRKCSPQLEKLKLREVYVLPPDTPTFLDIISKRCLKLKLLSLSYEDWFGDSELRYLCKKFNRRKRRSLDCLQFRKDLSLGVSSFSDPFTLNKAESRLTKLVQVLTGPIYSVSLRDVVHTITAPEVQDLPSSKPNNPPPYTP